MGKSASFRAFLRENDLFKVSLSDIRSFPYPNLAAFFVFVGNPNKALYVAELARARALTDLMATRYSVERQISTDPQSWTSRENIMKQESNCSCLYFSSHGEDMFFWIIKTSGVVRFRKIRVNESHDIVARSSDSLDNFFAKSLRSFGILPEEDCEDRSLNDIELKPDVFQREEQLAPVPQGRGKDNPKQDLTLLYNMIIAPVADLLEGSEIIIVPDPCLYHVPFPALHDDSAKVLIRDFQDSHCSFLDHSQMSPGQSYWLSQSEWCSDSR